MFKRFSQILLIVAVLTATGSHWLILQSVAWTTMLARNLETTSFCQAVDRTFDGEHPCCLCRQIAKGRKAEKTSHFTLQLKRLDWVNPAEQFVFVAPANFRLLPATDSFAASVFHSPPSPPPRAA